MTRLLEQAFAEASKLPEAEQNLLAERLLRELARENAFDAAIAHSAGKLGDLARAARAEHQRRRDR